MDNLTGNSLDEMKVHEVEEFDSSSEVSILGNKQILVVSCLYEGEMIKAQSSNIDTGTCHHRRSVPLDARPC